MEIIQRFIPSDFKETRSGIKMKPKWITIHETDNLRVGANAEAHARLQERGNSRGASWHLQIDDKQVIQSIPFDEVAWAAGDGRGEGNMSSIHIEICVNEDSDFKKAVQNAVETVQHLMKQFNIPIERVVQHNKWSGKNCPKHIRSGEKGVNWSQFIQMCTVLKDGWKKENNKWSYIKNGKVLKEDWVKDKGIWYYLDANGVMKTGWVKWKEKWYFLNSKGEMLTGLIMDKGKLYFLNPDGSMAANTRLTVTLNAGPDGDLRP